MGTTTEPVYLRVLEDLRARIHAGVLEPGARVPSRNAIITNYGVGETAAKHALAVLVSEGLIEARPGSGCYVRKVRPVRILERDRPQSPGSPFGIRPAAMLAGGQADDQVKAAPRRLSWAHETEQAPAQARIAERLGVSRGAAVIVTRYLLTADGRPVQLATSYEPAAITAGSQVAMPEQERLAGRGVVERLRSIGLVVDEVTEDLLVRPSLRAEAAALGISPGGLVLVVERAHNAAGRTVEVADVVIPADGVRLRYRFPIAGDGS